MKRSIFFARGFTELDSGEPSDFFIPKCWGDPANSLSFIICFNSFI